jgi:hypothetical protein
MCLDANDTSRHYVKVHHQVMTFVFFTRRIRIRSVIGRVVRHVVYITCGKHVHEDDVQVHVMNRTCTYSHVYGCLLAACLQIRSPAIACLFAYWSTAKQMVVSLERILESRDWKVVS